MPSSKTLAWRAAQIAGGVALGLTLAELGFRWHDDGAFPHLNLYVADAKLGVRLLPGGEERIAFADNPVTEVRINTDGYRGDDWGPPQDQEIVVLGDSQVFGLGVEAEETASAELARATGRPVRNGGVPTYGPTEYLAVLDELLAARRPKTAVIVVNFSNDLFEIDAPNTGRHAVWDGWAVRLETAPADVTDFPGRHWLYNQSHLFFGMRKAWWTAPEDWGLGVASEGTWTRVIGAAESRPEANDPAGEDAAVAAKVAEAAQGRDKAEDALVELYFRAFPELQRADEGMALAAVKRRAQPGDIVSEYFGSEGAREVPVTAQLLREGAKVRADLETRLGEWAKAHPTDKRAAAIEDALASRRTTDATLDTLAARVAAELGGRSPLEDFVKGARDRCDAAGAELVIAALPLDVQVSDTEWAKYGAEPKDMSATRALLTDLVAGAERLGVRAVDLTDALAAAEPGAFLDRDLHMSPKGQAAAGQAIAARLAQPAPMARPGPGLPDGRSRVPTLAELELAPEITVKGSTKAHCSTRQLREWLYVVCTTRHGEVKVDEEELAALGYGGVWYEGEPSEPSGVVVRVGEEALTGFQSNPYGRSSAALLAPLTPGRTVEADFWWNDRAERLTVAWEGDTPKMAFAALADAGPPTKPAVCELRAARNQLYVGDVSRGCSDTYADCAQVRDCGAGTRAHLPRCADGQVNAGSAGHCRALCDTAHPCASGQCVDWMGGRVCL